MHEQVILEDILQDIGRANNLTDFPAKLTFEEANVRLVQYNRSKGKVGPLSARREHWSSYGASSV